MSKAQSHDQHHQWTFISNHGHVLILLGLNSDMTVREIALNIGITERAVMRLISDLCREGFMDIQKVGRKNAYKIHRKKKLRHPIESACSTGMLIDLMDSSSGGR